MVWSILLLLELMGFTLLLFNGTAISIFGVLNAFPIVGLFLLNLLVNCKLIESILFK